MNGGPCNVDDIELQELVFAGGAKQSVGINADSGIALGTAVRGTPVADLAQVGCHGRGIDGISRKGLKVLLENNVHGGHGCDPSGEEGKR